MSTLTIVQEIYFDLCDLINSGQIDDIAIRDFQEFKTLKEFLEEQRNKIEEIEADLKETIATDDSRSYGPHYQGDRA